MTYSIVWGYIMSPFSFRLVLKKIRSDLCYCKVSILMSKIFNSFTLNLILLFIEKMKYNVLSNLSFICFKLFLKEILWFLSYLLYKSSRRNHLAHVLIAADVEASETLVGSLLFLFLWQTP